MPRRYASTSTSSRRSTRSRPSAPSSCSLGFLIHLFVFIHSLVAGAKAPKNPWGGLTLEWEADSPPSEHNFHHEPIVKHGPYDFETLSRRTGIPRTIPLENAGAHKH
jgi:cytochrome c oxidase subunit 1